MKKTYNIPTVTVVKIQPARILADSIPTGEAYNGEKVLSRRGRFSTWDDEEEFE